MNRTGISFGRSQRNGWLTTDAPGPGAYKVPVKIADVPKYVIPKQSEEFKFV